MFPQIDWHLNPQYLRICNFNGKINLGDVIRNLKMRDYTGLFG